MKSSKLQVLAAAGMSVFWIWLFSQKRKRAAALSDFLFSVSAFALLTLVMYHAVRGPVWVLRMPLPHPANPPSSLETTSNVNIIEILLSTANLSLLPDGE